MTDESRYNELREFNWRRELTSEEELELRRWLAAHPKHKSDWETELALTRALDRIPDVAIASNFTSRVLQAVKGGKPAVKRSLGSFSLRIPRFSWLPRIAFAGLFVLSAFVASQQVRKSERARMVESVAVVADVASLPTPEILRDFEVIRVLDQAPAADEELLRLLK
jgi:hypothetical protein